MFERFTERARQVVIYAQEEARQLNFAYIGSEHLLLGMLKEEDGMGAIALAEMGVTRELVLERIKKNAETEPYTGQIPFTPRAKQVLENALREALSFGHNFIGTEHIVLALSRYPEGLAGEILWELGADQPTTRDVVVKLMCAPRSTLQKSDEAESDADK